MANSLATHKTYYQKYCMGRLVNGLYGPVTLHNWNKVYYVEVGHGTGKRESYRFEKFI